MPQRLNKVAAFCGRRGCGKTTYLRKLIDAYRQAHQDKKILVVDTLLHPAYSDVEVIRPADLQRWRSHAAFFRMLEDGTGEALSAIEHHFSNGLLVFEDASKYINKNMQPSVRKLIFDSKQKNVDIIFLFHGFSFVPPEMFRAIDKITIFKTDNPEYRRSDIVAYEDVKNAYDAVMSHKSPYYHLTVDIY